MLPTCAAGARAALATGFAFAPASTPAVVLACLPMLLIHTFAVSLGRLQLVRKVLRKNQELDLLSRTDMLTGLRSRDHWEREVARTLHEVHAGAGPAVLVMIDVDGFKQANDRYGHIAGDALLREVAALLLRALRPADVAGRFGATSSRWCARHRAARGGRAAEAFRPRSRTSACHRRRTWPTR